MQGLDRHSRVITLGTFSKWIFPSLRLAWMVVPSALVAPFGQARSVMDGHSALPPQATEGGEAAQCRAVYLRRDPFHHFNPQSREVQRTAAAGHGMPISAIQTLAAKASSRPAASTSRKIRAPRMPPRAAEQQVHQHEGDTERRQRKARIAPLLCGEVERGKRCRSPTPCRASARPSWKSVRITLNSEGRSRRPPPAPAEWRC